MNNNKVPKIRFDGFSGDWVLVRLDEVAEIIGGGTPDTKIQEYWGGDVNWFSPAEIGKQRYLRTSQKKITEIGLKKSSAKLLPIGTVVYTSRAGIGNTAILLEYASTNQGFQSIVPDENKLDTYFIYAKTNELKRYGEVNGAGSTFVEISGKQMSKMPIQIPNLNEQQKIGEFFKKLDDRIALQQCQNEKLKQSKQGFLQKMFPKNGETVPEIRFDGFSGEWEDTRLGDLANIKTGSSDLQDADSKGRYPFFVRSSNIEKSNRYIFDGEAVLIPGEGRLGEIYHYINGKFDYHQRVYKISGFRDTSTDGRFIFYNLQKYFKRHALKYTVKATVDSLRLPILNEYSLFKPTLKEQQKIGEFFKQLDDLIAKNERELELLQETKKAFLQKMFV